MNRDRLSRHLLIAFLLSLVLYVAGYWFIESRRVVDTPWRVDFQAGSDGVAEIEIRQDSLALGPVRVRIESTNGVKAIAREERLFSTPKPVPFPVPLGQCVFQDTTFLPGTVVLEIAGIQIQMLPRTLTIGTNEFPWSSNALIKVSKDGWTETAQGTP